MKFCFCFDFVLRLSLQRQREQEMIQEQAIGKDGMQGEEGN
jgi:hypothetical protein